jgi:phosphatidylinositol glycan class Z
LVVADTAYFEGVDAVDAAFFGEAFFGGDADARAKRLASVVVFLEGFTNDFIATGVAWFRDPGLPPLDAFSQAWRETSVFVAATRGAAARLAKRLASAPWVVTPYNALAYNLDTKNLESHGIHPRLTHASVNFPMLFGPLAWVAYRASFEAARRATRSFRVPGPSANEEGSRRRAEKSESAGGSPTRRSPERAKKKRTPERAVASANATRAALLGVLAVPLVFLSLAPHQEPRFLLPALPAAAAAAAADGAAARLASSPFALAAWSAANLLGAAFFGFAHQGGVVPAVAQLSTVLAEDDESSDHALVYFWRTYTPPESLLAFPAAPSFSSRETSDGSTARDDAARASFDFRSTKNGSPSDTRTRHRASSISPSHIVDLRGASMDSVLAAFAANEDWSHFYVVAPATAAEALRARLAVTSPGAAVAETWRRRGHFSGEELAGYRDAFTRGGVRGLWDAMALGVYAVER